MVFAPVTAVAAPLACTAFTGVPPFVYSDVSSATVGDTVLSCGGGTPGTPLSVTFDFVLSVPVLSAGTLSDGVNIYTGTLVGNSNVQYNDVSFDPPGASTLDFRQTGTVVDISAVNPSLLTPIEITESISDTANIPIATESDVVLFVVEQAPEPGSLVLFSLGAAMIAALRIKKRMD